ncbi:MAG: GNAT family N-acetyltransferase [Bacillota bacterium]
MILYQLGNIEVRELSEEDAGLLVKWLSDERVLEYYEGRDNPHDIILVKKHFYERQYNITQCIIEYNKEPIGYLQYYSISNTEYEHYGYNNDLNVYGMDQFIGEINYWNRGIGTDLIKATIQHIIKSKQVNKIVMDPQCWNHRAIKVYEKCGFTKKKLLPKHEWHEGEFRDCWLIEYDAIKNLEDQ